MTTNPPNPVDGDVQALIERLNRIAARLKWNNVGYAQDVLKAVDLLTTQPAQLLLPVELPFKRDLCDERENGFLERAIGWNECIDEVQRLNATAQPVSDGCKVPEGWKLVPLIAFPSQWAAGQKAFDSAGINKVDAVYKAMVAAAPGGQDEQ